MICKPRPNRNAWPQGWCPICRAHRRVGLGTCEACLMQVRRCACRTKEGTTVNIQRSLEGFFRAHGNRFLVAKPGNGCAPSASCCCCVG
eukprot:6495473-Alexandrium_andersonii.AAC.1